MKASDLRRRLERWLYEDDSGLDDELVRSLTEPHDGKEMTPEEFARHEAEVDDLRHALVLEEEKEYARLHDWSQHQGKTLVRRAYRVLAVIVLPVLVGIFQALFGVVMNLLMNRFDYANDVVAIKSSMASGITMFAGVGVVALPVILYAVVLKASFALSYLYPACGIVLALSCFLMYYYLTHGAQKRFDMLGQG